MKKIKKGDDKYAVKDEEFDEKMKKKAFKKMTTPGVAKAMKNSQKEMGNAKLPKVKPQRKV